MLLFIKETRTPESAFKLMKCTHLKGVFYLMLLWQAMNLSKLIKQFYRSLSGLQSSVSFSEICVWVLYCLSVSYRFIMLVWFHNFISVDEAHRMKKLDCNLATCLKRYSSEFRLLLTVSLVYSMPLQFWKLNFMACFQYCCFTINFSISLLSLQLSWFLPINHVTAQGSLIIVKKLRISANFMCRYFRLFCSS